MEFVLLNGGSNLVSDLAKSLKIVQGTVKLKADAFSPQTTALLER